MITISFRLKPSKYEQFKEMCLDLGVKFYPSVCVDVIFIVAHFDNVELSNEFNRRMRFIDIEIVEINEKQSLISRIKNNIKYWIKKL